MYDLINYNLDLHGMFAAYRDGKLHGYDLSNLSEEDVNNLRELLKFYKEDPKGKKARKLAKVANFGLGGGMQARTFYINIRNAGFDMTLEEVQQLIDDWYSFYPEIKEFHNLQVDGYVPASTFDKNGKEEGDDDDLEDDEIDDLDVDPVQEILRDAEGNPLEDPDRMVKLFRTTNALGMVKAKGTKCAVANFNFQSYAAAANKVAMWWVYYAEWDRSKRLNVPNRFSINNFIHDELIFEVDEAALAEVVETNSKLMVAGVKSLMPGVLIKTEATVMTRWTKDEDSEYILKIA